MSFYDSATRASRAKFYNTGIWGRMRNRILKDRPLCEWCLKLHKLEPASVLDHQTPWRTWSEFLKPKGGFNALCRRCHREKLEEDLTKLRKTKKMEIQKHGY